MHNHQNKVIRTSCRFCYNNCGMLVHMEAGIPVKAEGDPENPMNKGKLCQKGYAALELLNHPDRLKHPLQRKGERGEGKWERITWDQALETIAKRLNRISTQYGKEAVVILRGASKGLSDDFMARFLNVFGSPNIASPAPYCYVPMVNASRLTYGFYAYPDYDFPPKCIVVWGTNLEGTHFMDCDPIFEAKNQGAKLIVIDPIQNAMTKEADLWIRLRPGTDLALALGMIHVIINENLYDNQFIDTWTVGFDELRQHIQAYTLEKVEEITWVPKEKIRWAAEVYAEAKPGCIPWGNGIETTLNGFQAARAIAILRSITGNLGIPGGDVYCSAPGELTRGDPEFVCQGNVPHAVRANRISMKDNLIPLAYYALPQRVMRAILDDDPYPVRAAYVQGANPLTHYTNARETYEALLKLDFLVVADIFMTSTATLADIVLPAATYLEFDSVEQPWTYPIASVQQKVAQVGESWPDGKILNELTKKLGFHDYAWADMQEPLNRILQAAGITFEEFRKIGYFVGHKVYRHYEKNGFNTPSKKVQLYSNQLKEWGFDALPEYVEPPETPASEPECATVYPFILTSRKESVFRHSMGRQLPSLREIKPDPIVKLHSKAAKKLGINEGEWVSISTRRGSIRQKAHLVNWIDPRVVEVDYACWFPNKGPSTLYGWDESNINVLLDNKPPHNREMGSPSMRGIFCKIAKEIS
ncbi:MAG: molybdopterin-dependent oxidoreductase [bacterium]|nr:molybdopterin-dependent oxidoreductase [bacterium]